MNPLLHWPWACRTAVLLGTILTSTATATTIPLEVISPARRPGAALDTIPDWFRSEIAYLSRDGGTWTADNPGADTPGDPFRGFRLTWTTGPSGASLLGRLVGLDSLSREHELWEFFGYWDAFEGSARIVQVQANGSLGIGELRPKGRDSVELLQRFHFADGSEMELLHVESRAGDARRSETFLQIQGDWRPQSTFLWTRSPS